MRSAATVLLIVFVGLFLLSTIVLIESGNVGVRKTLGTVNPEEVAPGLNFKLPAVSKVWPAAIAPWRLARAQPVRW